MNIKETLTYLWENDKMMMIVYILIVLYFFLFMRKKKFKKIKNSRVKVAIILGWFVLTTWAYILLIIKIFF